MTIFIIAGNSRFSIITRLCDWKFPNPQMEPRLQLFSFDFCVRRNVTSVGVGEDAGEIEEILEATYQSNVQGRHSRLR